MAANLIYPMCLWRYCPCFLSNVPLKVLTPLLVFCMAYVLWPHQQLDWRQTFRLLPEAVPTPSCCWCSCRTRAEWNTNNGVKRHEIRFGKRIGNWFLQAFPVKNTTSFLNVNVSDDDFLRSISRSIKNINNRWHASLFIRTPDLIWQIVFPANRENYCCLCTCG